MKDLSGYVLIGSVAVALLGIERLRPASPQQKGEWLNNGVGWILTTGSHTILVASLAAIETDFVNSLGGGLFDLRRLPWLAGVLVYFVAMDLGEYLFHRAQHAIPALWAMHSLHHSDRGMNVTTTQRHFWLEPVIKSVTIWLAVALLFHADGTILGAYVILTLANFLTHSNIRLGFGPLSWVFNSPQYHRLHHSREPEHHNANFAALLPIFDVISGAYRRPAPGEFPDTGLDEAVTSPLDLVFWPVRDRLQRAQRNGGPATAQNT